MTTVSKETVPQALTPQASRVVIIRCPEYEETLVRKAVGRGIELLGGAARFAKKGEHLLLKPNLLAAVTPEKAVTTHPLVFGAVAEQLQARGARLSYGDSPGFGRPESVARRAGLTAVTERLGIALADFTTGRTVSFAEGQHIRQFTVAVGALDCDGIISLPKLKSHALARMTGAIKNQFGCIPGLLKGEFHARLQEMDRFAQMIVEINRLLRPRLYVMDAIVAMEGNGPRNGTPKPMHALLFSEDPVALDATACRLMDLDPALVPIVVWGHRMGLGTMEAIELAGDPIEPFIQPSYNVNRKKASTTGTMNTVLARFLRRILTQKPKIDPRRCTRCGTCIKVCPVTPKAVLFPKGDATRVPVHHYGACIRCYCCQELCPERAIDVVTPPVGRIIHRASHRGKNS